MGRAKIIQYRLFGLLILLLSGIHSNAQKECSLIIHAADNIPKTISGLHLISDFPSKDKCLDYVKQLPQLLAAKGYISASVDSVWQDTSSVNILLFAGEKYKWQALNINDKDWPVLSSIGYHPSSFKNIAFDPDKVNAVYNQLQDCFSNNGYPFAKIYLDSLRLDNQMISANLKIDKGSSYYIDTIIVSSDTKISKNFLNRYLDIKVHDLYQQAKFDKINNRLAALSFLEQSQPYTVSMLNTGAGLHLYLQKRKSNQVNALIGFLPSNPQVGGRILITGEANLDLRNSFGNAERININWQQLQAKSPRLNLLFQRPYIFNSAVGISLNFELYKRDSFFLNIQSQLGLSYSVSNNQSVTIFGDFKKTNVLNIDTTVIKVTKRLPDMIDLSTSGLSFQYSFNNTNYRFNPRSGNELQLVTGFANKHIRRNNAITQLKDTSFNYNSLYDTIQQNGYEFRTTFTGAHYFPLARQATIKAALRAGWLLSPNYFQNELFQIGGFNVLRGFDEESIYTNRFGVVTLEYHYLIAQNSYFFAFTDIAYANYKSSTLQYSHGYTGVGTGVAFETKTGIFNISYALGKRGDLKWDFRQSKIHIGFVSVF